MERVDPRMGNEFAATRAQFRPHPRSHLTRSAVDTGRNGDVCHGPAAQCTRCSCHPSARRSAGPRRDLSGAVDLAAPERDRDDRHVDRLDLHALGRRVGIDTGGSSARCMVLAEAGRNSEAPRSRDQAAGAARRSGIGHSMISQRAALDVSQLPTYAYGHRSLMWWGTFGMIIIEGTVFALAIVSYFYLRNVTSQWPPSGVPPALFYGTLNVAVLLTSGIPNHWTRKAAEAEDLRRVRVGLV